MTRLIIALVICIVSNSAYSNTAKSAVILLSIDGFSYNYLTKFKPQNILNFAGSGASAKLLPVYPSKTFPNHLSIITGKYPANHGIIHNTFYHPQLKKEYTLGAGKQNNIWLTAKSFWSFTEENNVTTAVYFWPESEVTGIGRAPSFNVPYNTVDLEQKRFDQIITWLKLPESQAPKFIVSYFSNVDDAGHRYGSNSEEVKQAVAKIDKQFGNFIARIKKDIPFNVNIILLSDHGMVELDKEKRIDLSQVLTGKLAELVAEKAMQISLSSTQLYIYFDDNKLTEEQRNDIFYQLTENQSAKRGFYRIYKKNHYPSHWQFNSNLAIIPDLIIEANKGVTFKKHMNTYNTAATHGYDSQGSQDLAAIFIAAGPNIIKGVNVSPFENIHIVPVMSQLLGIPQMPNIDGKRSVLAPIIKSN